MPLNFKELLEIIIEATKAKDKEALLGCRMIATFEGNFTRVKQSMLLRMINRSLVEVAA